MRERCVGTLHGPLGDCLRPVTGGLLCYGYLDRDQGVALEDSMQGPVPMLFPTCQVHKGPLVEWAEYLWGEIADGTWVPRESFDYVREWFRMEGDPVEFSPDPQQAVRIVA